MKWYVIVGIVVVIILIIILGILIYLWSKGYLQKQKYNKIEGGYLIDSIITYNQDKINRLIKNKVLFIIDKTDITKTCYELFSGIINYISTFIKDESFDNKPKLKTCYDYLKGIADNSIFRNENIYFCGIYSKRFKQIYDLI